ncbi:PspA/IM30 family protein [Solilutibacter pythonis]|uniref:PspA/IM30 family protein n=1 Tax=Solilutibacter pythonis TaxID=2483112 RepID=UPI0013145015|nr:PspA/IM30 family protein [Lysobacter pythonis]
MSPLRELFERLQAEVDQIEKTLRGQAAERMLDEEIREIDTALRDWRNEAAATKARILTTAEREKSLSAEIRVLESEAIAALQARRKRDATEIAGDIARREAARDDERQALRQLRQHQRAMLRVIEQGEHKQRRLKHQFDTLRASEILQRAQAAVARRQPGDAPHPESAVASVKRARAAKQEGTKTPRKPATTHTSAADAVLARLRARADAAPASPARKPTGKHP